MVFFPASMNEANIQTSIPASACLKPNPPCLLPRHLCTPYFKRTQACLKVSWHVGLPPFGCCCTMAAVCLLNAHSNLVHQITHTTPFMHSTTRTRVHTHIHPYTQHICIMSVHRTHACKHIHRDTLTRTHTLLHRLGRTRPTQHIFAHQMVC